MTPIVTSSWTTAIVVTKIAAYIWIADIIFKYTAISNEKLVILSWLLLFDVATWILKQWKIDKTKISSYIAKIWILSKMVTLIALLSVAFMLKWLWINPDSYIKTVFSICITYETFSILQNVYAYRTWIVLPEYNVISTLIKKLTETIKQLIDKYLWKLNI